jgi:dipeptidyl aminopeptidase/acylaminoacyl peptidase
MIPFLHRAGYEVLAFDFRRLGESGGDVSTIGLREPRDLLGAVDYAAKRSKKPIFALGESMGAAACIMAAAQDNRIKAVIADSPYTSLDVQTIRRFGGGPIGNLLGGYAAWLGERILNQRLREASPLKAARLLASRPLLLIHSVNDRIIPVHDSEAIFAAIHGPKELWLTQASGHVRSYAEFRAEYQRRVLGFLHGIVHHRPVH